MGTRGRVVAGIVVLVALVAAGTTAWWLARPTAYADRDWSPLPAVTPQLREPWEPSAAQLATLEDLAPCRLLLAVDPTVDGAEPVTEGRDPGRPSCRSLFRHDQLTVTITNDIDRAAPLRPTPESYAWAGTEHDLAGYTAWLLGSDRADSDSCGVHMPAGTNRGLTITAVDNPVCRDLLERLGRLLETWRDDPSAFTRSGSAAGRRGGADPLPFTPVGEPTFRGTGDCVLLERQWSRRCAEHVDRDVPDDPVDAIRRGEADPDVLCTAALAAVEEAAPAMDARAVTVGYPRSTARRCVLLVGHGDGDGAEIGVGTTREVLGSWAKQTVAGHRAYPDPSSGLEWEVGLGGPGDPGVLEVDFGLFDGEPELPPWGRAFLEALVEDLLE